MFNCNRTCTSGLDSGAGIPGRVRPAHSGPASLRGQPNLDPVPAGQLLDGRRRHRSIGHQGPDRVPEDALLPPG